MEGADIPAFGEALAHFRTRAGFSQQRLAKRVGKNRRSVAAWELGEYLPKAKGDMLSLARMDRTCVLNLLFLLSLFVVAMEGY
jgi:transcriptional regulator with XRE-family HTH domain